MSTSSSDDDTMSDDESLDSSHDVEPVITKAMDSDRRIENNPSNEENPWGSGFNFQKSRRCVDACFIDLVIHMPFKLLEVVLKLLG